MSHIYKVISYGQRKNGTKTAEVIAFNKFNRPVTKHIIRENGYWVDSHGTRYNLK